MAFQAKSFCMQTCREFTLTCSELAEIIKTTLL